MVLVAMDREAFCLLPPMQGADIPAQVDCDFLPGVESTLGWRDRTFLLLSKSAICRKSIKGI
jgi:hypothetical protein